MFALRDYQIAAIAAVKAEWAKGITDTLVVMATGLGKTELGCGLMDELRHAQSAARFLWLAHRKELVEQPRDRLIARFPNWKDKAGIVMAEQNDIHAQAIFATVQTLASQDRRAELLAAGPIDYLIYDESHHMPADTNAEIIGALRDFNPALKHLGITATPMRADGRGMRTGYQSVAYKMGIKEGVKLGWLVPPRWLAIQTGISLAGIPSHDGDYTRARLADVFDTENCFDLVVKSHQDYATGRRALAFTNSVAGAHLLAERFNTAGITAAAADANTPKDERARLLRAFRNGEISVLCNMGLYTEGLDVPEVSCIHNVRPTKSDGLYTQMIGRALRIVPGKDDALILDYAPQEARNIVMAGDILGVAAKKEVYVKADAEPGEVIGGFTFDGNVKWLSGDPMELISRSLDYLNASPWVWDRDTSGWLILPLGKANDGIDRTLAMSPVADSMTCYLIAKNEDEGERYARAYAAQTGTLEHLMAWADDYAETRGQPILAQKAKAWRKQPPSDPQIKFARNLGVYKAGMSKGDTAAAITRALTMRALKYGDFVR